MPLRHLLDHFDLDLESLPLDMGTIRKLSKLTAQKPSSLTDLLEAPMFALQHKPQNFWNHQPNTQLLGAQRVQLCIPCLELDATPYIRKAWMSRAAYCCHLHQVYLLRRCPRCRAVLSVLHEFGRLMDYLNGDMSVLLVCLKCGYDLRASEKAPTRSIQLQKLGYTLLPMRRWPDFTTSLYLFVEKFQLNTLIDIKGVRIIKELSLNRKAALNNINNIGRTHSFFDELLFYLTFGSNSVDIDRFKHFGALCSSIGDVSSSVTRISAARFSWLGELVTRESEEWLASNIQSILYTLTLDDALWVKIDSRVEFGLNTHQKGIISKRVFGQPDYYRKAGFKKFLKFLSVAARAPSQYDMMKRLILHKHSKIPVHCFERSFVASIFTDLYIDHKISQQSSGRLKVGYEQISPQYSTEKLLHSFGTLELLRVENYDLFRLILSTYANSRTPNFHM